MKNCQNRDFKQQNQTENASQPSFEQNSIKKVNELISNTQNGDLLIESTLETESKQQQTASKIKENSANDVQIETNKWIKCEPESINEHPHSFNIQTATKVSLNTNQNDKSVPIPSTPEQVLTSPEREYWEKAIASELQSFVELDVWDLVSKNDYPGHTITARWIFVKKNSPNQETKFKARLVKRISREKTILQGRNLFPYIGKTEC